MLSSFLDHIHTCSSSSSSSWLRAQKQTLYRSLSHRDHIGALVPAAADLVLEDSSTWESDEHHTCGETLFIT